MIETVSYETHILVSAKRLIEHDLYKLVRQRHGKHGHAWSMRDHACDSCSRPISDDMLRFVSLGVWRVVCGVCRAWCAR